MNPTAMAPTVATPTADDVNPLVGLLLAGEVAVLSSVVVLLRVVPVMLYTADELGVTSETLRNIIKKQHIRYFGHIKRHQSLQKK